MGGAQKAWIWKIIKYVLLESISPATSGDFGAFDG